MAYFKLEEFIEILKKLHEYKIDLSNISKEDTIESLIEGAGLSISDVKIVINESNNKIGQKLRILKGVHRGTERGKKPTKEQIQELENIGVSLDKKDTIQIFIDKLLKLQKAGIDISKLSVPDTVGSLVRKTGTTKKILSIPKKLGLNEEDKIGKKGSDIREVYKGKRPGRKPTEAQVEVLVSLGILENPEKGEKITASEKVEIKHISDKRENGVQVFIDTLHKLRDKGVKVEKITSNDTLESLVVKKSGLEIQIIDDLGLSASQNIGRQMYNIIQVYRGQNRGKMPTQEQIAEMREFGVPLDKIEKKEKPKQEKATKQKNRAKKNNKTKAQNSSKKKSSSTTKKKVTPKKKKIKKPTVKKKTKKKPTKKTAKKIQTRRGKSDIIIEFIDIIELLFKAGVNVSDISNGDTIEDLVVRSGKPRELIDELGLKASYNVGKRKQELKIMYQKEGNGKTTKPTNKQIKYLLKFGVDIEENSSIKTFIQTLRVLKENGVDLKNLSSTDTIETLIAKSGKDRNWIISLGLNPDYKIGSKRTNVRRAFHGKGRFEMPSPKQIRDLNKLGIKLEYYDSIQSLIDILKILDSNNVYIRKIGHDQTVRDLVQRSEISIETIERLGIDLDYPIGFKMHQLKSTYSHRREKLKEEQM